MLQEHNNPFEGMTDVGQAEVEFNQFRLNNPDDIDAQKAVLSDMLDALLGAEEQLTGDADDFHNFAVTVSKVVNDNKNAYAIVREGLKIHNVNTDLLADALLYGANAGEKEACEEWYNVLMSVDKSKWTWRAFSFTITYLLNLYSSSESSIANLDTILALAKEYQTYLPDDESAWMSMYRVYDKTNQRAKAIEVLKAAIDKFRSCPKCCMRYADEMIDEGKYADAETAIRKMLRDPNATEQINTSYMHYLDGKCKMAKLIDTDAYWNGEVDEKDVKSIYRSFTLSRRSEGLRESVNQRIDEYINRLELETGVKFEDV